MSRTRRSAANFAVGVATSFVAPAVGLVVTPMLLRLLGDGRFGAFRTAQDWCGYVGLLSLGVTGALQPLLVGAIHRGDPSAVPRLFSASFRAYARVVVVMIALVLALAAFAPRVISVPDELVGELRAGIAVSILGFFWLPFTAFRVLAEAEQRAYLTHGLLVAQALVTAAVSVAFALAGFGLVGQFLATVIGAAPFALGLAAYGMRRHRGLWKGASEPADRAALAALNVPSLIWALTGRVGVASDSLVISAVLGAVAVVPFGMTQRLPLLAQAQVIALGAASWAALSELHQRGHREQFVRRLVQLTRYTAVLAAATLVPIAVCNRAFVVLWVGEARYGGPWLTGLTVTVAFAQSLFALWGWPLIGGGFVRKVLPGAITAVLLNLAVSIAWTSSFGLVGTSVGTLFGFTAVSAWFYPRLLHRELGVPVGRIARAVLGPACLGVAYAFVLAWFATVVPPYAADAAKSTRWFGLVVWLGTAGLCYLALAWFLVFPRDDRAEWAGRVRWLLGART